MEKFLELLNALCGHDNQTLINIRGLGFCVTLTLSIMDYSYNPSENSLILMAETVDYGDIRFNRIRGVERKTDLENVVTYYLYFDGGEARIICNLD